MAAFNVGCGEGWMTLDGDGDENGDGDEQVGGGGLWAAGCGLWLSGVESG